MNGYRLVWINALGSLVIATAALAAYHFAFSPPSLKFALVDVNDVYRAKEAQFSALIAKPGASDQDRDRALKLAQDFAQTFPAALDAAANDCRCVLLVTHAVVGHPADVVDLTASVRAKVGL